MNRLAIFLMSFAMAVQFTATARAAGELDPKGVAKVFETAINSGDVAATKAACIGSDGEIAAAAAAAENTAAEHKLSDEARAKFGDDSAQILAKPDYKPFAFSLEKSELAAVIDGDTARLTLPGRSKPLMVLKKKDGAWKVEIGSIGFFAKDPGGVEMHESRAAKVKTELAQEISIGQYVSAEDARRAMVQKQAKAAGKKP